MRNINMIHVTKLFTQEIPYIDPLLVYNQFAGDKWALFLDSSDAHLHASHTNRYSYIAIDPFHKIICKNKILTIDGSSSDCNHPFEMLNKELKKYSIQADKSLPPFQGGCAGFLAYDLCHYLEEIPYPKLDDMNFDDMALGFYDLVISFDNLNKKAWLISSGLPEEKPELQFIRAIQRAEYILQKFSLIDYSNNFDKPISDCQQIISNFSKAEYLSAVEKIISCIRAGDIFETNLTQRFSTTLPAELTSFELYKKLRKLSPAPFSAYFNLGETVIASASPERFILLNKGIVETRPIKGTRRRGQTPEEDTLLATELVESIKDNAENIMIVDLMRNDLSKICEINSIKVPQLCGLETYANVHHLVSVVTGKLKNGLNGIDILKACFPGGSITGAPKIKSMEIIAQTEPTRRGPYCGSIGYVGFDGCMDTSIVIRTYLIKDSKVTFQTGGAIVLDSCPEAEYEETLNKASALKRALMKPESVLV
jgi:para-aminobenzoate synthetase component I